MRHIREPVASRPVSTARVLRHKKRQIQNGLLLPTGTDYRVGVAVDTTNKICEKVWCYIMDVSNMN